MHSGLLKALISVLVSSMARAFSFSATAPTQCDSLNITWTGGQGPFQLLFTPIYGTPKNISIPPSTVTNDKGALSIPLEMPPGAKFLLTMSDSTGFGSGGTSQILTVAPSMTGTACNTTDPGTAFTYELPDALQQCNPYSFRGYDNAIQPITIYGLIPGGQTTIMNPPNGPLYQWIADVAAGTTMVFLMVDSQGRQGGSSDILTVASSGDNTCLNAHSPTSTAGPPARGTGPPVVTQTATSKVPVGAIAGTALGALIALAALVTLGLFFLKKWRDGRRSVYDTSIFGSSRHHSQPLGSTDHILTPQSSRPYLGNQALNAYRYPSPNNTTAPSPATPPKFMRPPSSQYEPRPFGLSSSSNLHSRSASKTDSGSPFADGELSRDGRQKAALAGMPAYKSSRFILHTDGDEPVPVEQDIVELPPQYTDRRQPPSEVHRQPSSSVRRQPSKGVRRRQSGNVPPQDIPPNSSTSSLPGGQS